MAVPLLWRRVRRHFGISAPRMAVRTRLPWWGRGAILVVLAAMVAGMFWWGFDFGQLFGGVNRKEIEARIESLSKETARLRVEAGDLRARSSQLESDLAMSRGTEQALTRQVTDLVAENAQLKEQSTFLQKLVADSSKQVGLTIPRLSVDREGESAYRYNMIVVRGGNPRDEFQGHVSLQAELAPATLATIPRTLYLPDDQPDSKPGLALKFKYYQRVEGTLRVPPGARLTALTVRAFEEGNANPRVSRTLTNP
jgi:hypothetical protein